MFQILQVESVSNFGANLIRIEHPVAKDLDVLFQCLDQVIIQLDLPTPARWLESSPLFSTVVDCSSLKPAETGVTGRLGST